MGDSVAIGETAAGQQPSKDERRKHTRYQCQGFAEVLVANACFLFRGDIRDISRTGCYIDSQARLGLKRGTEVELLFNIQGDQFTLPARIMIVRPAGGAGFEFLDGDPKTRKRLDGLLDKLGRIPKPSESLAAEISTKGARKRPARSLW
jgi:hypothetical protein